MDINKKLVGIRIMQRRKAKGLTQEDLSEQIGISKNHLSGIERGVYLPTISTIIKICNILGFSPDYYLIGQISIDEDEFTGLIRQLPGNEQIVLKKLLETYLLEFANGDKMQ